ncbi:hypothetical protein C7C46_08385 [Streptomyces tateyamensis]|uniref:DUF3592 domain-containing protein n=2 Tax=Streptomyces tateyamensis TaxID=565073 RepID=A0A2V4PIP6_9ACTN|nr:hypothetical protein C7C46_08385 [Streptomyces tateyamensis]
MFGWWTGLVLLVAGVPAAGLRLTRFARCGTQVPGTVAEVLVEHRHGTDSVRPVIRFTDPTTEREVVGRPSCGRVPLAGWPGQPITVRYLPDRPEHFQAGPQTSVFDTALVSLLVMTLGSVALVLTRWRDPDAIATSSVLGCSALALGTATLLGRHTSRAHWRTRLGHKGVLTPAELVGTFVVDGGAEGAHRYHPVVSFTAVGGERVTGVDLSTHSRQGYPVGAAPLLVRHLPEDPLLFALDRSPSSGERLPAHPATAVGLLAALACCGVLISVGAGLGNR